MSAGGGLFRQITYPLRDQLGVTDAVGTGDPLERDPGLRGKPADCDDATLFIGRAANRWRACQGGEDKRRIPAHARTSRNTVAHVN